MASEKKLKITLVKSTIGAVPKQEIGRAHV